MFLHERTPPGAARETGETEGLIPRLFVYGTLRRGYPNTHRLLGASRFVAAGTIRGTLYDLGKYPGVVKTGRRDPRVEGELVELIGTDVDRRFHDLDRYEGREFRRSRVLVRLSNGRHRWAWTYMLSGRPPKAAREILTGRYPVRRGAGRAA
jgi:gamma-glutamylcyclotransferase (GGCT)/AIG2-like uncharacterized protein YtfP